MARLGVIANSFTRPPGYVLATCLVAIGGFLNGYDTGSIGAVTEMPYFEQTFGKLSPALRGFTVSFLMLCGAVPSFFAGQLADKYGRLSVVSSGALIFAIGAVLQGAAFKLAQLLVGRALCGLGEGLWISCISVYITEIAPSTRRGTLVSMPQLMASAGICAGYFTCYGSIHIQSSLSWRAPFIVQAVLGSILATSKFVLPQSPRWLLFHGQRDKAIQELKRLDFSAVEAEKDLLGPAAEQQMLARPGPVEGLIMIFRKQYRKRTVLALFMLGMVQLSGIDGVLYYAPTLFAQAGLPPTTASFLASGLSAILMLAISIPALLLADRVPRRKSVLVGGTLLTSCMFIIGSLYASNSVHATGPARWIVIVLVFVFGLTFCSTWAIVGKIYASEIQPSVTRSSASCVAQGLGFFTNWLVAITTPIFLANSSFGAYFLFGFFCLGTVLVLAVYMPETRGQSLEAIREAFERPLGSSDRVTSWLRRWVSRRSGSSLASSHSSERIQYQPTDGASEMVEMRDMLLERPTANTSMVGSEIRPT
ncbi:hypothetical protein MBLNU459_g3721t1 [Dothideomycetes sp. NU459]